MPCSPTCRRRMVYELAEELNKRGDSERIPRSTIEKPPSAELRPNQKDTDSLPPYDDLDPLIEALVERRAAAGAGRRAATAFPWSSRGTSRGASTRNGVQAPPDAARPEGHGPGLRRGTALPDRPEVPASEETAVSAAERTYVWKEIPGSSHDAAATSGSSRFRPDGGCSISAPRAATSGARCATAALTSPASSRTRRCRPSAREGYDDWRSTDALSAGTWDAALRRRRLRGRSRASAPSRGCSRASRDWLAPGGILLRLAAERRQRHRPAGAPARPLSLRRAGNPRSDAPALLHASHRRGDSSSDAGFRVSAIEPTAMPYELAAPGAGARALEPGSGPSRAPRRGCWPTVFGYQFVFEGRGGRLLERRG